MCCTESFAVHDCSDVDEWRDQGCWNRCVFVSAGDCRHGDAADGAVEEKWKEDRLQIGSSVYRLQRGPWVYWRQRASAGSVYRWRLVYCTLYFDNVRNSSPSKASLWWLQWSYVRVKVSWESWKRVLLSCRDSRAQTQQLCARRFVERHRNENTNRP